MMRRPPPIAAGDNGWPFGRAQSTMATRNIVSLVHVSYASLNKTPETHKAATEESTGDVSDIKTKNDPEKAVPH